MGLAKGLKTEELKASEQTNIGTSLKRPMIYSSNTRQVQQRQRRCEQKHGYQATNFTGAGSTPRPCRKHSTAQHTVVVYRVQDKCLQGRQANA